MNRNTLDEIERNTRNAIRLESKKVATHSKGLIFGIGFLTSPAVVSGTFFVPLLGLLLSISLIVLTLQYLRLQGSVYLALVWTSGIFLSTLLLSVIFSANFYKSEMLLYVLIASATALLCALNLILAGLIWNHFDNGTASLIRKKGSSH